MVARDCKITAKGTQKLQIHTSAVFKFGLSLDVSWLIVAKVYQLSGFLTPGHALPHHLRS